MKKIISICLITWVLLSVFAVTSLNAQTTIQRSLYVSAKGNDNNNGRSEETPFKTLGKAVETANSGVIKTITVSGTITDQEIRIRQTGNDEILITGKPDASGAEKAVISNDIYINGKIRFTHILLTSIKVIDGSSTITLGAGVIVSNPRDDGITNISGLMLIMIDDAAITGCKGAGVSRASTVTMSDNASITNNTGKGIRGNNNYITVTMSGNASITNNGGDGIELARVTMSGNAKVSNNKGAGLYDCAPLTMSENAEISGNKSESRYGGGVYVHTLSMSGNAKIINNTTKGNGGGAYIRGGNCTIADNALISGNTAKEGGGIYLTDASLTMEGGEISGNKAENGAGMYVARGTFNHKGGTVTGNEADFIGGGVYVKSDATYTAGGGKVNGNTSGDMGDDNVFRQ